MIAFPSEKGLNRRQPGILSSASRRFCLAEPSQNSCPNVFFVPVDTIAINQRD